MSSRSNKLPVTHVLFDMDGLLLSTEEIYTDVYNLLLKKYGRTYSRQMKEDMMGSRLREGMVYLIEKLDLPATPETLIEEKHEIQKTLFPQAQILPGVEKLVRHLKHHGIPIAVATSSGSAEFELKTSRHKEFFSLFDCIIRGDDPEIKRGKPSPDIFLIALQRLDIQAQPKHALVFEDSPNGVLAGLAGEMQVVAIPDKLMPFEKVSGATQVLSSMTEFVPEEWGLPAY